jgi:hypothetical protein
MYVNCLNHTDERNQENAGQTKNSDQCTPARGVCNTNQTKHPRKHIRAHLSLGRLLAVSYGSAAV